VSRSSDQNRLLAALPHRDYQRLARYLEPVSLSFGQVLYEPGGRIAQVYFSRSGVISLLTMVGPGKGAEVGMVGKEGAVGASASLDIDVSHLGAVVQGSGTAARIASSRLRRELRAQGSWYRELFRGRRLCVLPGCHADVPAHLREPGRRAARSALTDPPGSCCNGASVRNRVKLH